MRALFLFILTFSFSSFAFKVGVGSADITGPLIGPIMMANGNVEQVAKGLHTRLKAQSFVVESKGQLFSYTIADLGMISPLIKAEVSKRLQKIDPRFGKENVMIAATHTHSGPGGFFKHFFYKISTLGMNRENVGVIVRGIVSSIDQAKNDLRTSELYLKSGSDRNITYNQSIQSHFENPERLNFTVNPWMYQLEFQKDGHLFGLFNWFSVHPTSLGASNVYVSGDNKSVARFYVQEKVGKNVVIGMSNLEVGDVSPNLKGEMEKLPYQRVELSGAKQASLSKELLEKSGKNLSPAGIEYYYSEFKMPKLVVNGKKLCAPGLGLSFAAGSEDGRSGAPYFREGLTLTGLEREPFDAQLFFSSLMLILGGNLEDQNCHSPKPLFIKTGYKKHPWTPVKLPFQVMKLDDVALVGLPFEVTTVAAHRIKNLVKAKLNVGLVLVNSLANSYAGYLTTKEEYNLQHYEAASNHFGPDALDGVLLALEQTLDKPVKRPSKLRGKVKKLKPRKKRSLVFMARRKLGKVLKDVEKVYQVGSVVQWKILTDYPILSNDAILRVVNEKGKVVATEDHPNIRLDYEEREALCINCYVMTMSLQVPSSLAKEKLFLEYSDEAFFGLHDKKIDYFAKSKVFSISR